MSTEIWSGDPQPVDPWLGGPPAWEPLAWGTPGRPPQPVTSSIIWSDYVASKAFSKLISNSMSSSPNSVSCQLLSTWSAT